MLRTGDENEELSRFDDETNTNTNVKASKMGGSADATLKDLMRRLEKLTAENNKLRRKDKGKKTKGGSSSSEDEDSSLEEDVSKKGKKEETITKVFLYITQCLSIMIICLALPLTLPYPLAKLPILMELVIINGSIA
jgi:hypothetical protein